MNILKQTIGQQKTPIKDLMKEATAQNHYFDYLPRPGQVIQFSLYIFNGRHHSMRPVNTEVVKNDK